jgi:hypothetical protein
MSALRLSWYTAHVHSKHAPARLSSNHHRRAVTEAKYLVQSWRNFSSVLLPWEYLDLFP